MEQYYIIPKTTIDDIENSIQRKRGSEAPIEPSEMPLAIDTIPSSVDGTDVPVGGIYLTKPDSNGNPTEAHIVGYMPSNNYSWGNMLGYTYFPYLKKVEFINAKNISSIGNSAFSGCYVLESVTLCDGIKTITDNAFSLCANLVEVTLPNDLEVVGQAAFRLANLSEVYLPDTVTSIGNVAFEGCMFTTLRLPNGLLQIYSNAFSNCTKLQNVTLENGFNCNNLNLSASTRYSVETMVSWFEALADRTGQVSFTLTIGATNLNKLTAEQKAIATNKNWTLA